MDAPTPDQRCRHRASWIIGGGLYEWCYHCGALRSLTKIGKNESAPASLWVRPTGQGGTNPGDFKGIAT